MKIAVEICVQGVRSAFAAAEGGADRVELCENLTVGGVTPSSGTIRVANRSNIPVQVLIRPRGGNFLYSGLEAEVMLHDIETCKALGASGVVLGILDANGRVDRSTLAGLIESARPMSVTFHKAFDVTPDPFEALDQLVELGVDRILTSGQAPTARAGLELLARLTQRSEGRIVVMAGGSIQPEDLRPLLDSGIREIHVGSAVSVGGRTDADRVRRIVEGVANS